MDPLSMAASIIAVLQLTTSLMSYCNDVRHASADQRKVAIEAGNLYGLLISLRGRVEEARSADDAWFVQVKSIGRKDGPLQQLRDVLEKMVKQTSTSGTRDRVKSALLWKFTKSETDAALNHMERLKSLIHLALSHDAFKLLQAAHERLAGIHDNVEKLLSRADQDLQAKLLTWLQLPDPSTNYHAALRKRHPGTGSWLLASNEFQEWRNSKSSFMWLQGKAGCGKTVLSATVLERLLVDTASQPDIVVAYFYFDFHDAARKRSSSVAAQSLLFQIATLVPSGLQALEQLHQQCRHGQHQPAEYQVRALLFSLLGQAKHIYIVLDAVDECEDRDELLSLIEHLASQQYDLSILATSRQESDIKRSLSLIANWIMDIESAVVDPDIEVYVRGRLRTDQRLRRWPSSIQERIADNLTKRANGMFQWANCQLETLRRCRQPSELDKTLLALPKDLDATYTRILQNIQSNGDLPNALKILRWLCFADQPLRLSEVVEVLAIETRQDGQSPHGFDPADRMLDPDDVQEICSGLISYHDSALDDLGTGDEDNGIRLDDSVNCDRTVWVRLAHFSVKEYLLSDRCCLGSELQPEICHTIISESCLYYLRHLGLAGTPSCALVDMYPLAGYAARYWWQHAQKITEASQVTRRLLDNIYAFLLCPESCLVWSCLYDIEHPRTKPDFSLTMDDLASPLQLAARIGSFDIVQGMTRKRQDVTAQAEDYSKALIAAARGGHAKVVQILLDAGADVNAQGGEFGNALTLASTYGRNETVQILLAAGADINAQDGFWGSALASAASIGHEETVQILLDAGADVNMQGENFGSALNLAAGGSSVKIVRMLLNAGADVNAEGKNHDRPLSSAAEEGHDEVVQILLDAGADVDVRGPSGTALEIALDRKHEGVAQILINAGAKLALGSKTDEAEPST